MKAMFQFTGNDDEAFFEVAAPLTYSSMEREESERKKKATIESAEQSDIPIDQPMPDEGVDALTLVNVSAPILPVGNSVKNVVQLNEESKAEATCHEEVPIDSTNAGGGGTMHALKKEQAEEGLQNSAVPHVNIVRPDCETTQQPDDLSVVTGNNIGDQPYSEMAPQTTKFPSFSPIETKENASAAGSEVVKRETKPKFIPSITTPVFQATVLEGGTSPEEAIVILTGAIEHEQVLPLDSFLNSVVQKNTKHLFCDVGGLLSINSSGWGILVSQMQRLRKRGGELSLCSLQGEVERSFKILDLDKLFPTFRTVSEAMRKTVSEPGNIRQFPQIKGQPGQSPELSLEDKIHRIAAQDPSLGITGIHKLLKSEAYGKTQISLWKLISTLNSMGLGSKEQRYRYFRSS